MFNFLKTWFLIFLAVFALNWVGGNQPALNPDNVQDGAGSKGLSIVYSSVQKLVDWPAALIPNTWKANTADHLLLINSGVISLVWSGIVLGLFRLMDG